MSLEMKPACCACAATTSPDAVAYICSEECTYCANCLPGDQRCLNCNGELQPRPRRDLKKDAPSMTRKRLDAFNQAWVDEDVPGLMSFMTDDCVYSASVGPEPGSTFVGREEVERGFREILAYEKTLQDKAVEAPQAAPPGQVLIHGHRGFSQWSYLQGRAGGESVVVRGCDWFEFRGRRIQRKDAFIKTLRRKP